MRRRVKIKEQVFWIREWFWTCGLCSSSPFRVCVCKCGDVEREEEEEKGTVFLFPVDQRSEGRTVTWGSRVYGSLLMIQRCFRRNLFFCLFNG